MSVHTRGCTPSIWSQVHSQLLVPCPFQGPPSLWFIVPSRWEYPSLWSRVHWGGGGGVHKSLVPGPFQRYPSLWSHILSLGGGVPRSGQGPPGWDCCTPWDGTRYNPPPPLNRTGHGQDRLRYASCVFTQEDFLSDLRKFKN